MGSEEDTIYVAVGEIEESELTLLWAIHNFSPRKVCILHVHQPSKMISFIGGDLAGIMFDQQELRDLEEVGRGEMHRILDENLLFCRQAGVLTEKVFIHNDDVGKGIVELIHRQNIKKLIMGAAADKHFSEGMLIMSKKAQYVNGSAPLSCQIWFICRGNLIYSRCELGQSSNAPSLSSSGYLTSSSEAVGNLDTTVLEESESEPEPYVVLYSGENHGSFSTPNGSSNDQLYHQLEQALQEVESSNRKAYEESDRRVKAELSAVQAMRQAKEFERLYHDCKRRTEAELTKQKEDLENMKRERDAEHLIAIEHKSVMESQVANSDHRIKQLEDKLSAAMEQLKISQKERDGLQVELKNTHKVTEEVLKEQFSSLHRQQFYPDNLSVSEVHDATLNQLQICQKEKDKLQVELENTRKITEEVLRKAEDTSSTDMQQSITEFSPSEIHEATEDFHPSFKIAEGNRGSIYYKCFLRHTEVAIKVLRQNSLQDFCKFQQEVDDLNKSRHPNLAALIGTCPEIGALIYEYLPNGSLEDRLNCRNDTPPLSSQARIRIATELCSALLFLHASKPQSIHGNLKPGNILLDANFGCKVSDFGAYRALSHVENLGSSMTESSNVDPYLDPDFRNSRRLSHSLDIYPFGIILLQLLSGRSTQGIAESAQNALLNGGNLSSFLDSSAGNWPYQVTQLTHLAIRCCDINRSRRPDLASEVLKVLEKMRASSGASLQYLAEHHDDNLEPPSYFICPILQEVMTDPHVAADGYTYEATAVREWLASHDTSPMTNLRLGHRNLVPNHALRSAIREWQQHS